MMEKSDQLKEIIIRCEEKFAHGPVSQWKHGDYELLSAAVYRKTGVIISANTLKRIFGKIKVEADYLPQTATFNALAQYCDYEPNQDERQPTVDAEPEPEVSTQLIDNEAPTSNTINGRLSSRLKISLSISTLLVLAIIIYIFQKKSDKPPLLVGSITNSSIEGSVPATAYFDLQLPPTNDSLFVDFGDKSAAVYISTDQHKVAHNYLFPGVFTVKLLKKNQLIATNKVVIQSKGWVGMAYLRKHALPNNYYEFPVAKGKDSLFHISNKQINAVGLDTLGSYYSLLANYAPIDSCTDNFMFETTFKNAIHDQRLYCASFQLQIDGMNGKIRFKFVRSGCSLWVLNYLSEKRFEGGKKELPEFVLDLSQWQDIKMTNLNRVVTVQVNGKQIFKDTYQRSIGLIKGVSLEFEGNGFVKNCTLQSLNHRILYNY